MSATQPNAVTHLTAIAVSVNEIDLTWVNNNPGFEAGATIDRALPGHPPNFQSLATVAAGVTSFADTTVQPGGKYSYRVTALPLSVRAFIPAAMAVASALTPGVPPHNFAQLLDAGSGNSSQQLVPVSDGSWTAGARG